MFLDSNIKRYRDGSVSINELESGCIDNPPTLPYIHKCP